MTQPSAAPKFSIGGLTKELAVGLLVRGIFFSFVVGTTLFVISLIVGLYLFRSNMLTTLLMAVAYGFLGAILGYVLVVTATAKRLIGKLEPELHRMFEPRINQLINAIAFGHNGISLAQFQRELDSKLGAESGPVSRLSGFILRWITGALRAVFLKDFTAYLGARRETMVTTQNAGAFVREKLIGLMMTTMQQQITGIRRAALVIGAIFCLGPLIAVAFV